MERAITVPQYALAKIILGLGVIGTIVYLSPWAIQDIFMGLVLPLVLAGLVVVSVTGMGSGAFDLYQSMAEEANTNQAQFLAGVRAAMREMREEMKREDSHTAGPYPDYE